MNWRIMPLFVFIFFVNKHPEFEIYIIPFGFGFLMTFYVHNWKSLQDEGISTALTWYFLLITGFFLTVTNVVLNYENILIVFLGFLFYKILSDFYKLR